MVLWGPQLLLHRLIALQAVAEWLGGLHSRPGYQGGIAFFWFRLSLELQAVTASHAPDGAASTEASKSSDAHDDDSAVTSDPVNELRSQSEQLAFGVTLLPSPDDEGSRSARALRLKDQLENLGVQRRKTLANLRNRRLRWSGESSYIRYRMKKDPAAFESPEAVALLKAKYRSAADKKRQAISALEQSVSDMKIEEARLRSRLAECRTGSGCAPGEPRAQGLPGPSAATGQSHGEAPTLEHHAAAPLTHTRSGDELEEASLRATIPHNLFGASVGSCGNLNLW